MGAKDNTSFFKDVYEIVRLIPPGKVTSYGAIANYLGTKSSARMVGWALSSAHGEKIPAHRVVNRNGVLTGKIHFGGEKTMQKRLEAEGITIINNRVKDFDKVFWDPACELL